MAEKLRIGDRLPATTLELVGGSTITLPDAIPSDFAVLLLYRGHW